MLDDFEEKEEKTAEDDFEVADLDGYDEDDLEADI
jgi:hypothetical protein